MHDYLLSTEWVRFAFVLGIAVSMILYERRHLTTGSIVVPGYIAVFMIHPLVLVATFANAFATYAIVNKLVRRYVLLYGRTKFTVLAVISTLIQTAMLRLSPSGAWLWERDVPLLVGVGYIVPALIAHDMARQGIAKTTKSVMFAGVIVAVPIALALALDLPGVNDLAPIGGFGTLAFPVNWLPVAVTVSILASWAVSHNLGCRSGGFIGAALMSMFMADPWQVVAALMIATATYLVVAKVLMKHMILFGRRKFSAMLLTSSAIAWPALWLGERALSVSLTQHLAVGSLALTPLLLPGLIANDVQRTSAARVALGLTLAGLCTVTTTWWVGATATGQQLALGWKVVAAATMLVLGWPQFVRVVVWAVHRLESLVPAVRAGTSRVVAVAAATETRLRGLATATEAQFLPAVAGGLPSIDLAWERPGVGTTPYRRSAIDPTLGVFTLSLPLSPVDHIAPPVRQVHAPGGSDSDRHRRDDHRVDRVGGWTTWADEHPDVAADAEAWLDAALGLGSSPITAPDEGAARPASEFDRWSLRTLTRSLERPAVLGPGFAPDPGWSRPPGTRDRTDVPAAPAVPTTPDPVEPVPAAQLEHVPARADETFRRVVRELVELGAT